MLNISKPTILRTFVISTIVSFCVLAFVMFFSKKNNTYNRFPEIYKEVRDGVKNTKPANKIINISKANASLIVIYG